MCQWILDTTDINCVPIAVVVVGGGSLAPLSTHARKHELLLPLSTNSYWQSSSHNTFINSKRCVRELSMEANLISSRYFFNVR